MADLGIAELARALSLDSRYEGRVRQALLALCDDPTVIAYRQAALGDLLHNAALAEALRQLLPSLTQLGFYAVNNPARPNETALQQVVFRLGELESYVECVQRLRAVLLSHAGTLTSEGWRRVLDALTAIENDPAFQALRAELPEMLAKVRNIGSVTIGVNLDAHLQPSEATLLAINSHRFRGAGFSLLGKLLGKPDDNDGGASPGLARLYRITLPDHMPYTRANLMLVPLFKDLSEILESAAQPVAEALTRYARLSGQFLVSLEGEIAFYLGAVQLVRRIEAAGLPMCRPEILPREARTCQVRDLFNLNLALRMLAREPGAELRERVVLNDARFDDEARIFVLTGPNQGGKTTYIQAIGLTHVLAQAGLPVPGRRACISPADAIFTHFAAEERPELESGRLGEEARRLGEIFTHATRHSLVLLNESLSSTSPDESLYLARDVVRGLRLLGARAIFATHLHGLAAAAEQINAETPGDSRVASLIAQTLARDGGDEAGVRTYKITPGPPQGMSYARDIARKYGISFEQIETVIRRKT
ncbi:MAG: hypothetical protein KatS3mg053_3618 [Candidatus Roseilinea sp.]|nr:MAG: hypothetical protein KatS3mg053_3618 [Candidatus Roseilinea sp.]